MQCWLLFRISLIYAITKLSLRLLVCLLMYATICAIHSCNRKKRGGKRWWEDIESEIGRRRGTISLEHSRASNHLLERKKKTLSFSQKRNTIFLESLNLLGIDLISLEIKFYIWKSTPKKYIQIDLEIKHYMFRIS